ncbi:MAG: hypothetical protein LBP59_11435 [Planctomycetaceae bacterium]|nr:hypothetical protein [Planctomycetaceae bacterium]
MRLYSTANERGLISQPHFCLPCGKVQAGRPRSVGLVCILDRRRFACISGSQTSRLHAVVLNRNLKCEKYKSVNVCRLIVRQTAVTAN